MKCGFVWKAPYINPPNQKLVPSGQVTQVCVLPKGHKGDHRSSSKVIHPQ